MVPKIFQSSPRQVMPVAPLQWIQEGKTLLGGGLSGEVGRSLPKQSTAMHCGGLPEGVRGAAVGR